MMIPVYKIVPHRQIHLELPVKWCYHNPLGINITRLIIEITKIVLTAVLAILIPLINYVAPGISSWLLTAELMLPAIVEELPVGNAEVDRPY